MDEHATWPSCNLHKIKLVLAARAVHTALYEKYSEEYNVSDPGAIERLADFLATSVKALDIWV